MTLSIGQRIALGFAIVIVLTAALGWYSVRQLQDIGEINRLIVERHSEVAERLLRLTVSQHAMRDSRDRAWQYFLLGQQGRADADPEPSMQEWERDLERTAATLGELRSRVGSFENDASDARTRALWSDLRKGLGNIDTGLGKLASGVRSEFEDMRQGDTGRVLGRLDDTDRLRRQFDELVLASRETINKLSADERREATEILEQARWSVIAAVGLVLVIAVVTVLLIHRSIMRPLGEFMGFVDAVGTGDLTRRTSRTEGDELGSLGGTLNEMVQGLADVAGQIRSATERLASSAAEIQAQAQQQAASTNEQNASIQQITSTMEEVSETGAQIAERANTVASGAEAASTASRSGLDAAEGTGKAMVSIREQAEEVAQNIVSLTEQTRSISEIIATVNDIAERSNLLAFNASIEAAAAGEHGETFSVVAEEIKHLADQAKQATGQVRGLLGDIQQGISKAALLTEEAVKRADAGETTSESALSTIRELVQNVEDSVNTFQQIVASTNQQQVGVEQVTQSVQSIREASEQMTSGTAQLEEAAGNLAAISDQLRAAVERYRL